MLIRILFVIPRNAVFRRFSMLLDKAFPPREAEDERDGPDGGDDQPGDHRSVPTVRLAVKRDPVARDRGADVGRRVEQSRDRRDDPA